MIVLAKEGDANAFAALLRQHQEMALRVAFQIVGDWDDAEDVCQESFVKIHRHLGRYQARHKFSTWLYRIVTRTAIDLAAAAAAVRIAPSCRTMYLLSQERKPRIGN